jgi:hypothetical protein
MERGKLIIFGIVASIFCASIISGQDVPTVDGKLGDTNSLVRVKNDIAVCFEKYGKESVIRV